MSENVVVIGGGIVGASAAYRLACLGRSVTLIDRADQGYATAAGAGIVAPATTFFAPPPWYPLAFRAAGYYPELVASLTDDGTPGTGYAVTGGLYVATDDNQRQRLTEIRRGVEERGAAGVAGIGEVSLLDDSEVHALFPPLADGTTGLHLTGAARVDGRRMRAALRRATQRRGGRIVSASARLAVEAGRAVGVHADGTRTPADAVILATGAWHDGWADCGARQDGPVVPVAPQRGQILHLDLPGVDTSRWPVVVSFTDPYLLAFPGGRGRPRHRWQRRRGPGAVRPGEVRRQPGDAGQPLIPAAPDDAHGQPAFALLWSGSGTISRRSRWRVILRRFGWWSVVGRWMLFRGGRLSRRIRIRAGRGRCFLMVVRRMLMRRWLLRGGRWMGSGVD